MIRNSLTIIAVALGLLLLLAAATGAGEKTAPVKPAKTPATFITQWVPQAQFAGYYVAREKGFYRKRGLALKIIDGGPERSSVASGWSRP